MQRLTSTNPSSTAPIPSTATATTTPCPSLRRRRLLLQLFNGIGGNTQGLVGDRNVSMRWRRW